MEKDELKKAFMQYAEILETQTGRCKIDLYDVLRELLTDRKKSMTEKSHFNKRINEMDEKLFHEFEVCLNYRAEENQHVLELVKAFSKLINNSSNNYKFDEIQKALYTIWSTMSDVVRS